MQDAYYPDGKERQYFVQINFRLTSYMFNTLKLFFHAHVEEPSAK